MPNHIRAGFSERAISPEQGVSLCGYFNNRYNRGSHDDLYAKAMAVSDGKTTGVMIAADNAMVFAEVVGRIRKEISPRAGIPEHNIFVQATHTHTAPVLKAGTWVEFSPPYLEYFVKQTVAAALEAHAAMQPVTFAIAEGEERRVAFCRRFIMRDGSVATNPPKDSSDIVGPESPIDHSFAVIVVKNLFGAIIGVLLHCANHVDTIGGDLVSADWPGVLCRIVTENLTSHPQTMLLNGMAGNINHYDINDLEQENGFAEAERIGSIYAGTALNLLRTGLQPLEISSIDVGHVIVDLPRLKLTEQQIRDAGAILERPPLPPELPTLHSVDLAQGSEIVSALFARKQLGFAGENIASEAVEVSAMRIGDLLLIGFPMETFSEIGMEIKKRSPFRHTFPLGILNGKKAYLGTREAAERPGGMETFPGVDCLRRYVPEAADMLTNAAEELAQSLAKQAKLGTN